MLRSNASILQKKTAKINIVRHPAKLFNILDCINQSDFVDRVQPFCNFEQITSHHRSRIFSGNQIFQHFFYFLFQKSERRPEEKRLLKQKHLFDQRIRLVKIHLKPTGFSLLWKLANMVTFIFIISSYEGSEQST